MLGRVHGTRHEASLLRGYLWWGLVVRTVLLLALGLLLIVEGNVLAEWLLTARLPFVSSEDIDELSAISYTVLLVLLTVGIGARWHLLYRIDAVQGRSAPAEAVDGASSEVDD